tara:strand:+ start:53 stop:1273 length:1221 start_codon:yes stop_codon:yes gene_type:complete
MFKILKNKTFLLFFMGNIISLIGFGFNMIAVSWLVIDSTGSEYTLGKIIAISTLPGLIVSIFTGFIIDKFNRKHILICLDLLRLLVIITFLFFISSDNFEVKFLYPLVFFMGIFNSVFWSTAQAFTQEIINEKDYFNANKLLSASYQIGSIIGAGIGGVIVHFFDPFFTLSINAIAYFISAFLIFLAPFKYIRKNNDTINFLKSNFEGFKYLFRRKDIFSIMTTTIMSDVAVWGAMSVLTLTISIQVFDKGSWGYGLLDGFYGFGALYSIFFLGFISNVLSRSTLLKTCYFISMFSLFLSTKMPNIYLAIFFFFMLGLFNNSARVIVRTILMENVNNNIMGRVQTILGVYTRLMVILSSLLCGYFIELYNIDLAIFFTCIHYLIAFFGVFIVRIFFERSFSYLKNG